MHAPPVERLQVFSTLHLFITYLLLCSEITGSLSLAELSMHREYVVVEAVGGEFSRGISSISDGGEDISQQAFSLRLSSSLLDFFGWKRSEKVLRNFCNTLSVAFPTE